MASQAAVPIVVEPDDRGSNDPWLNIAEAETRSARHRLSLRSASLPAGSDLYTVKQVAVETIYAFWPRAPESAEEFIAAFELDGVVTHVERLVHDEFGPNAYLRRVLQRERDTGEQSLVLEAHYCFAGTDADLLSHHNRLMERYVAEVPFDTPVGHVLTWVPDDAD